MNPLFLAVILLVVITAFVATLLLERGVYLLRKRQIFQKLLSEKKELLKTKEASSSFFLQKLRYAGLQEYLPFVFLGFFLLFTLLGMLLYLFLPYFWVWILALLFAFFGLYRFIHYRIRKRAEIFNASLMTMISLVVRMLRNGVGFEQAIKRAIMVNNNPLFRQIMQDFLVQKNRVGEEEAFKKLSEQIDSKELRILAIAVKIGKEKGGSISSTLEKLEKSLIDSERVQRQVDVKTQETKVGSYLILILMATIFFILDLTFNGDIHRYFFSTLKGKISFLLILLWIFIGLFINSAITRIRP